MTDTASTPTPPDTQSVCPYPATRAGGRSPPLCGQLSGLPRLPHPACSGLGWGEGRAGAEGASREAPEAARPALRHHERLSRDQAHAQAQENKQTGALKPAQRREEGRPQSPGSAPAESSDQGGDSSPAAPPSATPPLPQQSPGHGRDESLAVVRDGFLKAVIRARKITHLICIRRTVQGCYLYAPRCENSRTPTPSLQNTPEAPSCSLGTRLLQVTPAKPGTGQI